MRLENLLTLKALDKCQHIRGTIYFAWDHICCFSSHANVSYTSFALALGILHFFANLVAEDFVPVNLGTGDGQLAT